MPENETTYNAPGILESLLNKIGPVYFQMFGVNRRKHQIRCGLEGDQSPSFIVLGRTYLIVEVDGLPEDGHGEIIFEGTINGKNWFTLFRAHNNGIFNIAEEAHNDAIASIKPTRNGNARIALYRIRAAVTSLPEGYGPVSCVVLGTE